MRWLTDPLTEKVWYLNFRYQMSFSTSTHEPGFHPAASDRIEPYVWRIAGVVILGMIMSILDTTIVNVALHTLGHDLHSTVRRSSGWSPVICCRWPP